jgi:phosphate transport system substrate-binding protein
MAVRGPIVALVMALAWTAGVAEAEPLSYVGSPTLGETIIPLAARAFTAKTGIRFDRIEAQGSSKGLEMVLSGEAPLTGLSRSLSPTEKRLRLHYEIVGYDAMAVFVHPGNRVKVLTRRQLKEIYTGRVTNWKDVGGADAPIVPVTGTSENGRSINVELRAHVMDGLPFAPNRWEIDRPEERVTAVAGTPNAIVVASLAFARAGVRSVAIEGFVPEPATVRSGAYILSRPLLLVARADASPATRRFLAFMLSGEGQQIIARKFVPVR